MAGLIPESVSIRKAKMANEVVMSGINEAPPRVSEWRRFRRVFFSRGVVVFGLVVITILILVAIFAPLIAPYDPYKTSLSSALQQTSQTHLLGTD